IGIDRLHLVFAGDSATLVDDVDRDLRADRAGDRARRRERPRKIIDDADPDRRFLGANELAAEAERRDCRRPISEQRSARGYRFPGWPPYELFAVDGRDAAAFTGSIWITSVGVNAPVTSAGNRERTAPSKIGCTSARRSPVASCPQAVVRPPDKVRHGE